MQNVLLKMFFFYNYHHTKIKRIKKLQQINYEIKINRIPLMAKLRKSKVSLVKKFQTIDLHFGDADISDSSSCTTFHIRTAVYIFVKD